MVYKVNNVFKILTNWVLCNIFVILFLFTLITKISLVNAVCSQGNVDFPACDCSEICNSLGSNGSTGRNCAPDGCSGAEFDCPNDVCGGGSCFLPGTQVQSREGDKKIEDIKVGDTVTSFENGKVTESKVSEIYERTRDFYYSLVAEDYSVKASAEHPFLVDIINNTYKEISKLVKDDIVYVLENNSLIKKKVTSNTMIDKSTPVYNLQVDNTHTFFANDFAVHNKGYAFPTCSSGTLACASPEVNISFSYIDSCAQVFPSRVSAPGTCQTNCGCCPTGDTYSCQAGTHDYTYNSGHTNNNGNASSPKYCDVGAYISGSGGSNCQYDESVNPPEFMYCTYTSTCTNACNCSSSTPDVMYNCRTDVDPNPDNSYTCLPTSSTYSPDVTGINQCQANVATYVVNPPFPTPGGVAMSTGICSTTQSSCAQNCCRQIYTCQNDGSCAKTTNSYYSNDGPGNPGFQDCNNGLATTCTQNIQNLVDTGQLPPQNNYSCYSTLASCQASCTGAATTPVGTCGTFNTTNATTPVTWTWANGTGLRVRETATGAWWYNNWATSPLTIYGIPPGTELYALSTSNFVNFSNQGLISPLPSYCPMPANPPPTVISGFLRQKSGTGCYLSDASNNFNVSALTASTGDSCVTALCDALPPHGTNATSYSCTVTWDNAGCVAQGRQPDTAQTLTMSAAATGYSNGQFSNSSCTLSGTSLAVNAGVNNLNADIAFPFTGDNWIKLKDSSYTGKSITGIAVPAFISSYDADDDASKYFIIGSAGLVINTTVLPSSAYSTPKNWHDSSYTGAFLMNPSGFLSYVKSRKTYKTINSLDETSSPDKIDSDGIYFYSGATLDINSIPSKFNQFNVVIIVQGVININTNLNGLSLKSVALLATNTINFASSVDQANGIFISQTVATGSNNNQGLKIKGNLIAQTTLTNGRAWSDTSKPSIFVVFDQIPYINLLPYLSTASYDWRQIQ